MAALPGSGSDGFLLKRKSASWALRTVDWIGEKFLCNLLVSLSVEFNEFD